MDDPRYAPPRAPVQDIPAPPVAAPALWNPGAAAGWSVLFSPIFGAWLHNLNWQALGEPEKAAASRRWAFGCLAAFVVIGAAGALLPDGRVLDLLSRLSGLALLLGWYYGSGRAQTQLVAGRFGKTYPRKGWAKPLLLGIAGWLAFFIVLFAVFFALGMAAGV